MALSPAIQGLVSWVKRNPLYSIIAGLAPVIAVVSGLPTAVDALPQYFGRPQCWTYSNIYYYYAGHFKQIDNKWTEFQPQARLNFDEFSRDANYIVLLNKTPREDSRWASMLVRLPVCGGAAQWTYENPEQWVDLFDVARSVSPETAAQQAKYEQ